MNVGMTEETVHLVICECKKYEISRKQLMKEIRQSVVEVFNLKAILNNIEKEDVYVKHYLTSQ